jgi:hypothetical protein
MSGSECGCTEFRCCGTTCDCKKPVTPVTPPCNLFYYGCGASCGFPGGSCNSCKVINPVYASAVFLTNNHRFKFAKTFRTVKSVPCKNCVKNV